MKQRKDYYETILEQQKQTAKAIKKAKPKLKGNPWVLAFFRALNGGK